MGHIYVKSLWEMVNKFHFCDLLIKMKLMNISFGSCLHEFLSKVGLWLYPAENCNAATFKEANMKSFQRRIELSDWSSSAQ